jgi:hypothetical protein
VVDKRGGPRFAVAVDGDVWTQEVERLKAGSSGRVAAEVAWRVLERDGARKDELAACEPEAADGTRLGGCVKLRIPLGKRASSEAPYGLVFEPSLDGRGRLALGVLAFGERHPVREATRSVYERAHRRLHGEWPKRPRARSG